MKTPPIPANEKQRLHALQRYKILDTPFEKEYDDIVKLIAEICEVPFALISLIDSHRQWNKAMLGNIQQNVERNLTFCAHAINQNDLFVIEDALNDDRVADNPFVVNPPGVRFYAGKPLTTPDGYNIGTLCVIDTQPRKLNEKQKLALEVLANQVIKQLELRIKIRELESATLEIKHQSAVLQKQSKKLKALNETKDTLLAIISHDLRSPLNALTGLLSILEQNLISQEDFIFHTRLLKDKLNNLNNTLETLLHWASSQLKHTTTKAENIDLKVISQEIVDFLSDIAKNKNIVIKNNITNPAWAWADKNHMRLVLRNLISNAIKFTHEGGEITIWAEKNNHTLKVFVKDTGVGISPEKQKQLFSSFGIDKSTRGTKGESGTGLGLMLCKEFLEKNCGKIGFESQPGKGSTFFFTIPASC
ncbi:MAG: GAF domain-containing sensor histidine kinase [Microscillaceae bacterium]|nr:GAF domain-containing sensor histidine kinase [Microscillaceae bacterium]MDW8460364.1 GAF domain-containing sensor histidine kinase [Cytophagales bacterium]